LQQNPDVVLLHAAVAKLIRLKNKI
jgi:hypothetical protein